jgi:hypothetical protein
VYIAQAQTTHRVGCLSRKAHAKELRHDRARHRHEPDRIDRLLAANEEPPLGAHLVTPRILYSHHGVYVGGGKVVHYAAFAKLWARGPVEEISLADFADGHELWVRTRLTGEPQCDETLRRARSRLGENRYRFLSNNCEHFSEWCVNGEHRSLQVERLLAPVRGISHLRGCLLRWLAGSPLRSSGSQNRERFSPPQRHGLCRVLRG